MTETPNAPQIPQKKVKITRTSIVEQVCQHIKENIVNGVWKPGEKLPSEAEFSEMFSVNRLSVRMALQKLNTLGIIETRVGEGSFVRNFSLKPVLSELTMFYAGEDKYQDVRQLRHLLESECLRLAIDLATDEEKKRLTEALDRYNQCSLAFSQDIDNAELLNQTVDADFAFHYQVIKMSHNALYKDIYYMVQQLIRDHMLELIYTRSHLRQEHGLSPYVEDENASHSRIYQSIIHSDPESARKEMEMLLGIVAAPGLDKFE